ncbi:MAG: hypothetical protein RIR26_1288 [Pseudomonadota bacterium]
MRWIQTLQCSLQIGKGWAVILLALNSGCVNQNAGPIKKIPSPERPAAPEPTQNPFGTFSPHQLYTAQTKTYLKTRSIDSSKLAPHEKCEILENTQVVLKTPPGNAVNKHWSVQLQLRIPGCPLDQGYLFAEHWKQSPTAAGPSADPCGLPADLDLSVGKQLAQEASRLNIGRFTGRCYEYAGMAIENVGLMPKGASAWQAAGVPVVSAADFVQVEKSSVSDRFVRLRPSSWACLPEGTIVVWDRGMCGFNATHGHIEVVVTRSPAFPSETKLCSDGCQTLQTTCSIQSGVSFFFPRKRASN